jgi:hypothetical protein
MYQQNSIPDGKNKVDATEKDNKIKELNNVI